MPNASNPYLNVTRDAIMSATSRHRGAWGQYAPETLPPLDVPLLEKGRDWVNLQADLPAAQREWRQDDWVQTAACGTAFCFAGYIGNIIAGDALDHRTQEVTLSNGEKVHVSSFAEYWLGLPEHHSLFNARNDKFDINTVIDQLERDAF